MYAYQVHTESNFKDYKLKRDTEVHQCIHSEGFQPSLKGRNNYYSPSLMQCKWIQLERQRL